MSLQADAPDSEPKCRIRPNIRRVFFFKYCSLEKGGRLIFEALRINFKKTVPVVKRGSFLLKWEKHPILPIASSPIVSDQQMFR
jgi:hypothetical protein